MADHHVRPDDAPTRRWKIPERSLVGGAKRPLPGDSVFGGHENLDLNLEVGKGAPIHPNNATNAIVSQGHPPVREVNSVVRCKELTDGSQVIATAQSRIGGENLGSQCSAHGCWVVWCTLTISLRGAVARPSSVAPLREEERMRPRISKTLERTVGRWLAAMED